MNFEESHIKFLRELEATVYQGRPDLEEWCLMFTTLVHLADDIVDEPKDVERTMEAFSLARRVWQHPVYLKWAHILDVIDELNNSAYIDSEVWSKSEENWKKLHADVLRHQCYNMFFALIYLECGRNTLRKVTLHFREYSHMKHLADFKGTFTSVAA